jgi:hypothetical protein
MRFLPFCLLTLICTSCYKSKPEPVDSNAFLSPTALGKLTHKKLSEVSGIAASVQNPGALWTLNDSNNPAEVYLVDENLNIKLTCKLGVKNRDWEDIEVGPGPVEGKHYVYVGDIGDNNGRHEYKYIYRFEEPVVEDGKKEITIRRFETFVVRLADAKKDTETLMVHPKTKYVYLVSKREQPVVVYELKAPLRIRDTLTAVPVTSLPLKQIVGGSISPDGNEVLLKNYDNIYYWNIEGMPLVEGLKARPQILPYVEEPQGESIAFNRDASGFYTLSEKIKGEDTYLYFYARSPAQQ